MDRYTKKDAENCAGRLAKSLGKKFGNCWSRKGNENKAEIGCWTLDNNPTYGGSVIEEIMNESGGVDTPFGSKRLKPEAFCDAMRIAEKAVEIAKEKK